MKMLGLLLVVLGATTAKASPFQNLAEIISSQNFSAAYSTNRVSQKVKVAILDNGFKDYGAAIGKTLPTGTIYHAGPVANPDQEESHGRIMAELVTALMTNAGKNQNFSFELHLYAAFGYSNLQAAVNDVIKQKMDVVLYSQVWEYGGNNDGHGFINSLVDQATQAGILWVNAAGNFGQHTFNYPVTIDADQWVTLPDTNNSLQVRCQQNSQNQCPLRIVLSWNDFKDDVNKGTNKDLDLVLADDAMKIIQTSGLSQKDSFPEGQPGMSKYPREILEAVVKPGVYQIKVKARSQNFSSQDKLRITVTADHVTMPRHSKDESLLNPADNPNAITVGASDTAKSSFSKSLGKPDLLAPSLIRLGDGQEYKGSSQSAAIVAAGAAIIRSYFHGIDRQRFLQMVTRTGEVAPLVGEGLPLSQLNFSSNGSSCFTPVPPPTFPVNIAPLIISGAKFVATTAGVKVFTVDDPIWFMTASQNIRRTNINDMLLASPQGFFVRPRHMQDQVPAGVFEVIQIPLGQSVCGWNKSLPANSFRLPQI